jgi:hypothetical protein
MSEFIMGTDIPEEIREMLEGAPPPIKSLIARALGAGKSVEIIDFTKGAKPGEKKDAHTLKGLLGELLGVPAPLDTLKMTVTQALTEADPGCGLCAELSGGRSPMRPPIARCLQDRDSAAEVLLKGAMKLTAEKSPKERLEIIAKVFNAEPKEFLGLLEELAKAVDKNEEKEGE